MTITTRAFCTWFITNITGSFLATLLQFQHFVLPDKNLDSMTTFFLYFVFGSFLSLPAILFTYFNLRYVSESTKPAKTKRIYLIFSVPGFLILGIFLLFLPANNIHNFKWDELLMIYKMVSVHIVLALVFTLFFAKDLIDNQETSSENLNSNPGNETIIHKI